MIDLDLKNACPSWLRTRVLFHEKGESKGQWLFKFLSMLLLQFWGMDILVVHRTTGYDVLVVRHQFWGSRTTGPLSVSNADLKTWYLQIAHLSSFIQLLQKVQVSGWCFGSVSLPEIAKLRSQLLYVFIISSDFDLAQHFSCLVKTVECGHIFLLACRQLRKMAQHNFIGQF